ncbi:MAG: cupin domain-containing protein [Bryobacteraceae bacterium]|jgi:anti-sigma factor ChrR (cupin superfamily)|nr:cupin domain-containing protein [Bryobacteraceae bacterium]
MTGERSCGEFTELTALYALGALSPEEAHRLEEHLAGCEACRRQLCSMREVAALLAEGLARRSPSPELRAKLLDRVRREAAGVQLWKSWGAATPGGLHIVRRDQGRWEPVGLPGVWVKQLYADPDRDSVTMLIRMEPGAAYPSHRHGGPEQCLVLEGDLRVGDVVLQAGDFQCAPFRSTHDVSRTENGCLLLIVCSQHDELLA